MYRNDEITNAHLARMSEPEPYRSLRLQKERIEAEQQRARENAIYNALAGICVAKFARWATSPAPNRIRPKERDMPFAATELTKIFAYLDNPQGNGPANMFGASMFVHARFGLNKPEARKAANAWSDTFDSSKSVEARVAAARDFLNR